MLNQFSRTELLLGKGGMERLKNARVAVFGIGGVGGYTVEALARSGVGTLDLIDDDKVCLTNLNRQIIATRKTVGKYKVDVAKERILEINPDAVVHTYKMFYMPDTADQFASSVTGAAEGKGSIAPHGIVIDDGEEEAEEVEAAKTDDGANTETMPIITENLSLAIPNGDGEEADAVGDEQKSGYDLNFEYADGTVLSGSLNGSVLSFHEEGRDKHSVTIEFQDNVWVSTVTRDDGTITTLRCDVDGFHFTVSKAKGADVPDEKVYVWLSDGTGAKREDISA